MLMNRLSTKQCYLYNTLSCTGKDDRWRDTLKTLWAHTSLLPTPVKLQLTPRIEDNRSRYSCIIMYRCAGYPLPRQPSTSPIKSTGPSGGMRNPKLLSLYYMYIVTGPPPPPTTIAGCFLAMVLVALDPEFVWRIPRIALRLGKSYMPVNHIPI